MAENENNQSTSVPSTPSSSSVSATSLGTGSNRKREYVAFKLIVDPALVKASFKSYRYDGRLPEDPSYPLVVVRDPRNKIRAHRIDDFELIVPFFKIDKTFVGKPPSIQVTVTNLNDNIDRNFFKNILAKHWNDAYDDFQIFHHPVTHKHLGLAHISFKRPSCARTFVEKLNNTSIMGQKINVFLDPFVTKCKELVEEHTVVKKPEGTDSSAKKEGADKDGKNKTNIKRSPGVKKDSNSKKSSGGRQLNSTTTNPITTNGRFFMQGDGVIEGHVPIPGGGVGPKLDLNYGSFPFICPPPPPDEVDFNNDQHQPKLLPWAMNTELTSSLNDDNDDFFSPKVDLDTRIRQVFSGNRSMLLGIRIPMLESSDSEEEEKSKRKRSTYGMNNEIWSSDSEEDDEDEEEEEEETVESAFAKKFKKNTFVPIPGESSQNEYDMSPPPSPFLSLTSIDPEDNLPLSALQSLKLKLQAELEKVASDESHGISPMRRRTKKKAKRAIPASQFVIEDPSQISLPPNPPLPNPTDLPPLPPGDAPLPTEPTLMPAQYYPQQHPQQPQQGYWPDVQMPYPPYMWNGVQMEYPPFNFYPPNEYDPYNQQPTEGGDSKNALLAYDACSEEESDDEELTVLEVTKLVIDRIYEEMKNTLLKDFHRRLLENEAYKKFEVWCQKREELHKMSTKQQQGAKSAVNAEVNINKQPMIDFSESLFSGSMLGGNLRCAIPKLPSFRKNIQEPVYQESRKSSEPESERSSVSSSSSSSSSEEDDEPIPAKRKLKISIFSDATSTTSSTSEGTTSSSEEDVSDFEDEIEDHLGKLSPVSASSEAEEKSKNNKVAVSKSFSIVADDEVKIKPVKEEVKVQEEIPIVVKPQNKKKVVKDVNAQQDGPCPEELYIHEYYDAPDTIYEEKIPLSENDDFSLQDHTYSRTIDFESFHEETKEYFRTNKAKKKPPPRTKSRSRRRFRLRDGEEKTRTLYDIFYNYLDDEDVEGLRLAFENSLAFDSNTVWLNCTHWVEYPATAPSIPKKRLDPDARVHKTGSARTEGYYALTKPEKAANRRQWGVVTEKVNKCVGHVGALSTERANSKMQVAISREARSNQRRLLTALGNEVDSDLLKFNQLKFRKKDIRFGRSTIHDWGLFASEAITENEMVIEYVGQMIRPVIADLREKKYMAVGIGSSYLFRIDLETIIDATRSGNLSRFINHSCNPNCYAKIITIEGRKKIVIYSKQPIAMNEEITYDYKFPIEDEKIPCLCGSIGCRGTLN